jgi:hypothetical protein
MWKANNARQGGRGRSRKQVSPIRSDAPYSLMHLAAASVALAVDTNNSRLFIFLSI